MTKSSRREQSLREELVNAFSHGIGLVAMLAGAPILLIAASKRDGWAIVSAAVFAASVALLYFSSTVYHGSRPGRLKSAFQTIDHAAIFLLIAGTYTPFTLGVLRGPWGWTLFGMIWFLAAIGIVNEVVGWRFAGRVSMVLYLGMGWLIVIAIRPLLDLVAPAGIALLVAGGLAYTGGVAFYALDRVRYAHCIWHLCVLTGTTCHFFAVLMYSA
jgi:hemolysin III